MVAAGLAWEPLTMTGCSTYDFRARANRGKRGEKGRQIYNGKQWHCGVAEFGRCAVAVRGRNCLEMHGDDDVAKNSDNNVVVTRS